MKRKWIAACGLTACALAGLLYTAGRLRAVPAAGWAPQPERILMIDAGHGGEDGGASSAAGAIESRINLAIACKLEDILALYGIAPEMTRREDISLYDSSAATLREKKASDLHNRAAMVEELNPWLMVSIHQNSFPESRYHGAQVFYAPTPGSEEIAQYIQEKLAAGLDPDNTRGAKEIPDSVYLMNHISCPAVLVECGFLSNPQEAELLSQDCYQRKLAAILAGAILTIPEETENT